MLLIVERMNELLLKNNDLSLIETCAVPEAHAVSGKSSRKFKMVGKVVIFEWVAIESAQILEIIRDNREMALLHIMINERSS